MKIITMIDKESKLDGSEEDEENKEEKEDN